MSGDLVDVLRRENEMLREQIAELRRSIEGIDNSFAVFGFTASEYRLFSALMEREALTKDQITSIIYADRIDTDLPNSKIIDVFVCKARKKIGAFGVKIDTVWGRGYCINPEMKKRVRALTSVPDGTTRAA